MKYLILTCCILLLGCKAVKPIVVENYTRDSVFVREVLRDTVVEFHKDSSAIRALIECDSIGNAHIRRIIELENGNRIEAPKLSITDNILKATAQVDSQAIYLALKDTYTTQTKETVKTQIVEINVLTWWQKLWCTLGKILSGVVVVYVGCKLLIRS